MRIDQHFTRQEMALLTGIDDDVLAFWIKNGILVSSSGGAGKGSHRKFTGHQVNIAGMLAELRNFGINISGLRSFARVLQRATALCETAECNYHAFNDAIELRNSVDAFKSGRPIRVWSEDGEDRLAKDLGDIIADFDKDPRFRYDTLKNIAGFVDRISAEDVPGIKLFMGLNGVGYEGDATDDYWVAVRSSDDEWTIVGWSTGSIPYSLIKDGARSGILLATANIVREIWGTRLTRIARETFPLTAEDEARLAKLQARWDDNNTARERQHTAKALRAVKARAAELGLEKQ